MVRDDHEGMDGHLVEILGLADDAEDDVGQLRRGSEEQPALDGAGGDLDERTARLGKPRLEGSLGSGTPLPEGWNAVGRHPGLRRRCNGYFKDLGHGCLLRTLSACSVWWT